MTGLILKYNDITIQNEKLYPLSIFWHPQEAILPTVKFDVLPNKFYTIIMVDKDPANKKDKYWLHWLKINVTDKDLGKDIVKYHPPAPPKATGIHRYYLMVFSCENKIVNLKMNNNNDNRTKFNPKKFKNDNNLKFAYHIMFKTSSA